MLVIAYTKNEDLAHKMNQLEELRRELHTVPMSRKSLYALQWDAQLTRIEHTLKQDGHRVHRSLIHSSLTSGKPHSEMDQHIQRYNDAFNYIRRDWFVTDENISPPAIATLDAFATGNTFGSLSKRTPGKNLVEIKQLLSYIQSGNEHPLIQAGIVYIEIVRKQSIPENSQALATLVAYMFLYKYGWEFRDLLTLEKIWSNTHAEYKYVLSATESNNNATMWLNYFVSALADSVKETIESVSLGSSGVGLKETSVKMQLKKRHMEIVSLLEDPLTRITNKEVQRRYGVSQITASRDLGMLTMMGLLFTHGKGRSTYYTRA